MKNILHISNGLIVFLLFLLFSGCEPKSIIDDKVESPTDTIPQNSSDTLGRTVYVKSENGRWQIMRKGQPFFIKGASAGYGTDVEFKNMQKYGGNSIRLYDFSSTTKTSLDLASKYGVTVMQGIWFLPEEWFDYSDQSATSAKLEEVRSKVRLYRNHPALLAWGIGNEVVGENSSDEMFKFMNEVSIMIHQEDSNHITSIVTAGITTKLANKIADLIPDIDFVGVNYYAGIPAIYPQISASRLKKPYVVTEWGVNGEWEVGKTPWGCPIEDRSRQKAIIIRDRYNTYISGYEGYCIGSYAFLWGDIQDWGPTWFSLFYNGNAVEQLDELTKVWTGSYPTNRAPSILSSKLNGSDNKYNTIITNSNENSYIQQILDLEGDAMDVEYIVQPYNSTEGLTSDNSHTMKYIPGIIYDETTTSCKLKFTENMDEKAYKLYVIVKDSKGRTATEVFPFKVSLQ
ncbi:MAG: glycoside hydrolase family 2 TIM barrel-domain containing protein [Bacteroidales bacterium]|nr:glycoside hydrolase family 2 TIM barrel-domain containing protein [Bacteroidales bacterium]